MPITANGLYQVTYGNVKGHAKHGKTGLIPRQQLLCLMGLAQGKTHEQIGQDQNLTTISVTKTIQRAYDKLSDYRAGLIVRTAGQAIYEAMRRGIIAPLLILLALGGPLITNDDLQRPTPRPPARITQRTRTGKRENEPLTGGHPHGYHG